MAGVVALALLTLPAHAQQAVQAATSPPVANQVGERLPSWLRVGGEFRERVEGIGASGFISGADDTYFLSRLRISATVRSAHVSATVQVQDSRVGGKTVGSTGSPFSGGLDFRQAYADIGGAARPVSLRVGRQEVTLGDQRLIGVSNWSNVSRTFDAARLVVKSNVVRLDIFAASAVRIQDGFDKSGHGNRIAGVQLATGRLLPLATVEPYVFYRRDVGLRQESGALGTLSQVTIGVRVAGRAPASLDYNIEVAAQGGSLGADDVGAWAGHWVLRHSLPGPKAAHISGEFNYASGDQRSGDGERGTFDQLYQSGHDKHGLADQVGWRNIRHARLGFDVAPVSATPITVNWHSYWLADRGDGLYSGSGSLLARVPGGAASARVGQEFDVQVVHPFTPHLTGAAGYAHLFPGAFLKQATPGHAYRTAFAMLTVGIN